MCRPCLYTLASLLCTCGAIATTSAAQSQPNLDEGMLLAVGHTNAAYLAPLSSLVVTRVDMGRFRAAAIQRHGRVVTWDYTGQPLEPFAEPCADIAVGEQHVLGLTMQGEVHTWCANAWACAQWDLTCVPNNLPTCTAVTAGGGHSMVLTHDGQVHAWGRNSSGQCNVPSNLLRITAIAAGEEHSLVLDNQGVVHGFGADNFGQSSLSIGGVTAIAAGAWHSLALLADGTVVAYGRNDDGQASVPTNLGPCVAIAAGERHSVALRADGTVVAWGGNHVGQATMPNGLLGCTHLAAGAVTTLLVTRDCDADGVDDYTESAGRMLDCNQNSTPDHCDVLHGLAQDLNHDLRPDDCELTGRVVCAGDPGRCPCGAQVEATRTTHGCPNSYSPQGARLSSYGFSSITCDEVLLEADSMPPWSSVVYYQGTLPVAGGLGLPFGDGLRCVSGSIVWLGRTQNQYGRSVWPPSGTNLSTLGHIAQQGLGVRYYQAWYRDPAPSYCSAMRHNFTNAITLNWVP